MMQKHHSLGIAEVSLRIMTFASANTDFDACNSGTQIGAFWEPSALQNHETVLCASKRRAKDPARFLRFRAVSVAFPYDPGGF